jgi:hypothetical protein
MPSANFREKTRTQKAVAHRGDSLPLRGHRFVPAAGLGSLVSFFVKCRFLPGLLVFCLFLSCGIAEEKRDAAPTPEQPVAGDGTAEFVKDREKAQRDFWARRMEDERKWLAKTLALSPEQVAALARFADDAVKRAMAEWTDAAAAMAEDFRQNKDLFDEPPLKVLMDSWNDALASRVFGQYRAPEEQPMWREGLAGLLTPGQSEVWQKQAPARVAAFLKPFLKQAKEVQEEYRDSATALLEQEATKLSTTFELREGQEKKVQALARRLANRRLAEWRTEAAHCLADQPPEDGGGLPGADLCVPEPRPVTVHDAGWIEGLGKILDPAMWRPLANSLKACEARRPKVLAQMLVLAVDEEVRCTAREREQLLQLAERWVQAKPDLFQEQHRENLTMPAFLAAAARASQQELAGVLDDAQVRHWRRVCVPGILDEMGTLILRPARGLAQAKAPAPLPAGAGTESLLQAFLVRAESKVRTRALARAVGCAQEIGRVCALPEETRALLQTAARGAVEASLREWRILLESTAREQIEDLEDRNPETLRVQLEQMEANSVSDFPTPPEKQPLWTRTLKKVMQALPSPQAAAWRKEESARAAFRRQTIARFVLEDFSQAIYLTAEQVPKVEPMLEQAIKAHAEELEQRDSGGETPWYLSPPENLAPINFIPEAKLRPLLTAQQWSAWSKSEAYVEPEAKR